MPDSPPEVLGRCPPQHNHAPEAFCTLTLCPFPAPRRDEHRRRVPGAEFADGRLAWCTAPRLLAAQLELPTVTPCSHSEGLRPRGRLGTHAWTALGPLRAAAARSPMASKSYLWLTCSCQTPMSKVATNRSSEDVIPAHGQCGHPPEVTVRFQSTFAFT